MQVAAETHAQRSKRLAVRGRGRTLVALLVAFVADAANAQAQAEDDLAIVVRAGANGSAACFEADALRQRIAHYSTTGLGGANMLRLELDVVATDSAELSVYRDSELVARRRFEKLPELCADRRDAVALSIALALDGVIHELTPDDATSASEASSAETTRPIAEPSQTAEPRVPADHDESAASKPRSEVVPKQPETPSDTEDDDDEQRDAAADVAPARVATGHGPPIDLHLGGRWLAEALPAPVWTAALGAEIRFGRWFALDGSAMASTTGESTLAGARAQSHLIGGELLGCAASRFGEFAAQGCLGAVAAACEARGADYPVRFPAATVAWAASTARVALRWPEARRVSVRAVLQGHVNMVRPELRVDGSSAQLAPAWLGGSLGLDMLVSLE